MLEQWQVAVCLAVFAVVLGWFMTAMGAPRTFAKLLFPGMLRWRGKVEVVRFTYGDGRQVWHIFQYSVLTPGDYKTKAEAVAAAERLWRDTLIETKRVA